MRTGGRRRRAQMRTCRVLEHSPPVVLDPCRMHAGRPQMRMYRFLEESGFTVTDPTPGSDGSFCAFGFLHPDEARHGVSACPRHGVSARPRHGVSPRPRHGVSPRPRHGVSPTRDRGVGGMGVWGYNFFPLAKI